MSQIARSRRQKARRRKRAERLGGAEGVRARRLQPTASTSSPWADPQAGRDLLRRFDKQAELREKFADLAAREGEWAGLPLPLDGEQLVIDPSYPFAETFMAMGAAVREVAAEQPQTRMLAGNCFWSWKWRSYVQIVKNEEGRAIGWQPVGGVNHVGRQLRTMGCSDAWSIEAESKALQMLGRLVGHRSFRLYLLTGAFLWTSPRSGLHYMFRKLRPTLALREGKQGTIELLCALCSHTVGYYAGSFAGVLCPTDEVIAHFLLAQADERMFWRRSNQHPAWSPNAGL
jgi:hypothetical protein